MPNVNRQRLTRHKPRSSRAAVVLRGGGVHQAALQEPAGGHGAQRLPLSEEAGGPAHQAHRRDPGHAAGDAGGHDHRWVVIVGGSSSRARRVRGCGTTWACEALSGGSVVV